MTSPYAVSPLWENENAERCPICMDGPISPLLPVKICAGCAYAVYRTLRLHLHPILDEAEREADAVRIIQGAPPRHTENPGFVYYIRRGTVIKIGHTVNLRRRMVTLLPDEVLAVEPGPIELEGMRHQQFAEHRLNGEYFADNPDLRSHIAYVVEHCGPPPELPTLRAS